MGEDDYQGDTPEPFEEQTTQGSEGQDASGQDQGDQQTVPLDVVKSMREELKEAKERARQAEQYIQQMQSSQAQSQQSQSNDPLEGLEDDEFLTAGQARKIIQNEQQKTTSAMREVQMRQQYSDYDEVIGQYLPNLVQEKPYLRDAIMSSQDPYSLAYELGKAYKQNKKATDQGGDSGKSELDRQLEQHQQKPGSASQASSQSKSTPGGEDYYSNLSMDDLEAEIRKVRRGEAS